MLSRSIPPRPLLLTAVACALCAISPSALAQPARPAEGSDTTAAPPPAPGPRATTLSQEQAVAIALRRHPAIAAARKAVEAAEWRTSQTRTAWIPRVKAEAGYMLQGPVQQLEIDTGITPPGSPGPLVVRRDVGSLHNFSAGVSAGWRVFEFGARWVRTEAAEALERAADAKADEQAEQIAYAVRAAYLATRFFHEVEAVTDNSLTLAREELRQEDVRHSAGLGSDLDLARIQLRVAELEAQLAQSTQERERTLATLRLLLGYPVSSPLTLSDDLATLGNAPMPASVDREAHPLVRQVTAMHDAAEREHARLGRTYFPTLDVMGSVKYQYPESPFASDQGGVLYSAGVVLSWNILDGDLIRRQRGEAEAQMGELDARALAANEEIDRQLTDARAKMRTAESAVATAEHMVETAEIYLKAADAALDAGAGTDLEKRKASERADQAHLALLKAYFDGALARADYLSAAGLGTSGAGPRRQPSK